MNAAGRKKGQARLFVAMVALVGAGVSMRYHLDFLTGLGFGISIPMFFLGFRALYQGS